MMSPRLAFSDSLTLTGFWEGGENSCDWLPLVILQLVALRCGRSNRWKMVRLSRLAAIATRKQFKMRGQSEAIK